MHGSPKSLPSNSFTFKENKLKHYMVKLCVVDMPRNIILAFSLQNYIVELYCCPFWTT